MTKTDTFEPATRLDGLGLSGIVQISEQAARLKAAGQDIISLSTGEPDLPTPAFVIDRAHAAAREGATRYTPTAGTNELQQAIARDTAAETQKIIVSTGAKQVLANALLATLNTGDEVILPTPFWTSYADMVTLAGGIPVRVPCSMADGFKLSPDRLAQAITPKTRWLMLNSPSNPSGAVYAKQDLQALAQVLKGARHVWVISDEIYRHLSYVPFTSFRDAAPELRDRTLVVDGVSKAWAMTGWRIGWGIGPAPLIDAMTVVQGQSTSGASSVSQAAAVAALNGDRALLKERCDTYKARRDLVVGRLNAMPGITCRVPDGAFYAFPNCEDHLDANSTDADVCAALLERAGIALVPGRAFGAPGHLRLSFAYSNDDLTRGLDRLQAALERGLR